MELLEALSLLSKSSPYAVSTERSEDDIRLKTYKDYIYIETPIEKDFRNALFQSRQGDIVFLCGSSGDGKSEILTRYSKDYRSTKDFHLDATHSFVPSQTAIQALDEKFTEFKSSDKPLIIGINIGMLGNYAEEGSVDHQDIKESIKAFLARKPTPPNHIYLDFESYPKFYFKDEEGKSDFTEAFLKRLTNPVFENPFYALYSHDLQKKGSSKLLSNFSLLSNDSVQKTIVELLLKARLIKDQFLTARALLDLVFQILAMDGYLFDNLFTATNNEILEKISSFDPSSNHTKYIDEFILEFSLGMKGSSYIEFEDKLKNFNIDINEVSNPQSILRALYVLKLDPKFSNDFTSKLASGFDNKLVERYAKIWSLHHSYDGEASQRRELNRFYRELLIPAIHGYCNRNSPYLDNDTYFIREFNGFQIAVEMDVKADFSKLKLHRPEKIGVFNAFIQFNDIAIKPMAISINIFELLEKINQGYRPNKHDKNAVLQLEDVIEQILDLSTRVTTLQIFSGNNRYKITNEDGEYFEVSGI